MIVSENLPKVKEILLGSPSEYRSKSIEKKDKAQHKPKEPIAWIGRGPVTI